MKRVLSLFAFAAALACGQYFPPPGGGMGSGTVTDVTIHGTAGEITVTGTCNITTSGTCTISLPSGLVLPGTINKLTLTEPATGATLTIADGKTITVNNTLTLDGTDATTINFPAPASVTNGNCVAWTKSGSTIGLADAGAGCASGGSAPVGGAGAVQLYDTSSTQTGDNTVLLGNVVAPTVPAPVPVPTCSSDCTHTWSYEFTVTNAIGESLPGAVGSTLIGSPALSPGTDFNTFTLPNPGGCQSVAIYVTAGPGVPAGASMVEHQLTCGSTFVDDGSNGFGPPPPTLDASIGMRTNALTIECCVSIGVGGAPGQATQGQGGFSLVVDNPNGNGFLASSHNTTVNPNGSLGLSSTVDTDPSLNGDLQTILGGLYQVTTENDGTVASVIGFQSTVGQGLGNATIPYMAAIIAQVFGPPTGTVTAAYGIDIIDTTGMGATAANIFSEGTGSDNIFQGVMHLPSLAPMSGTLPVNVDSTGKLVTGSPSASSTFEVTATSTVVTIPGTACRNNNVPFEVTQGTITAGASSLATGAEIWIECDPVTAAFIYDYNADVTPGNLTLSNVTQGAGSASGYSPGRVPIAHVQGGSTTDQWTVTGGNVSPHNEPTGASTTRLAQGTGIGLSTSGDGTTTISTPGGFTGSKTVTSCTTISGGVPTGCSNVTNSYIDGLLQ